MAEEEQERGRSRGLESEEEEEVEEYGLAGLRYENGELLLARDEEAMGGAGAGAGQLGAESVSQ